MRWGGRIASADVSQPTQCAYNAALFMNFGGSAFFLVETSRSMARFGPNIDPVRNMRRSWSKPGSMSSRRRGQFGSSRRTAGDEDDSDPGGYGRYARGGTGESLARPGGNTTGFSILATELDGKRQEILIEAVQGLRRMGALADANSDDGCNSFKPCKRRRAHGRRAFSLLDRQS